jgi:hypothetical protein
MLLVGCMARINPAHRYTEVPRSLETRPQVCTSLLAAVEYAVISGSSNGTAGGSAADDGALQCCELSNAPISSDGTKDGTDTGRDAHCESAPESHTDGWLDDICAAGPRTDRAEQGGEHQRTCRNRRDYPARRRDERECEQGGCPTLLDRNRVEFIGEVDDQKKQAFLEAHVDRQAMLLSSYFASSSAGLDI